MGSAPFKFMVSMSELHAECPVDGMEVVAEKCDGWFLELRRNSKASNAASLEDRVHIFTRGGVHCKIDSSGIFGAIARVVYSRFVQLDPYKVKHPVYGKAGALYGEIFVVREDAVATATEYAYGLDDLRPMLLENKRADVFENRTVGLKLFWCSFVADDPSLVERPSLTWSERLHMCRAAFGQESVVRVFLDVGQDLFDYYGLIQFWSHREGFVFMKNGRFYKSKAVRPVNMLLLAAGFTKVAYTPRKKAGAAAADVQHTLVPTCFYWGVEDPSLRKMGQRARAYAVPFVEDVAYLFDERRAQQGKATLSAEYVVKKASTIVYEGRRGYFADLYNALLRMACSSPTVPHQLLNPKTVRLEDGRMLCIGANRSASFLPGTKQAQRLFVFDEPRVGVVGFNHLWMTGAVDCATAVHFQAARLAASGDFGPDLFRTLLKADPPKVVSAACLVHLATRCSRALGVHALEVYGPGIALDLHFGGELDLSTVSDSDHGSRASSVSVDDDEC